MPGSATSIKRALVAERKSGSEKGKHKWQSKEAAQSKE